MATFFVTKDVSYDDIHAIAAAAWKIAERYSLLLHAKADEQVKIAVPAPEIRALRAALEGCRAERRADVSVRQLSVFDQEHPGQAPKAAEQTT